MSRPPTTKTLGRYQVIEEIGKGAMGVVYLARDPTIGRLLALKTFRTGDFSEEEQAQHRERFMREAQSAGILSHPNIVTIHDFVEDAAAGVTFIAMEFVRGTDLKQLLRGDEPFDLPFISRLVWQVAEALEYAHNKGVVHRDIKPANMLITADDRLKLTDFGIARLNTSDLTYAGQLLGTPNYMAPEQIRGKEVDHRADIFSLGVVLYEMLTRNKPFAGDNLTVVTHRIVNDSFTPPEEYIGELPPGLMPVLEKALAKNPDERYQRVGELARDLKAVADQIAQRSVPGALPPGETQKLPAGAAREVLSEVPPPLPPVPRPPAAPAAAAPEGGPGLLTRLRALLPAGAPSAGVPAPGSGTDAGTGRPWLRYGLLAAATAVLTLLLGLGAVALVTPDDTRAADRAADAELEHRFRYLPWVWGGRAMLAKGDAAAAVGAFAEARRLAPEEAWIRELEQEARERVEARAAAGELEASALASLENAEQAFERRRYEEAEDGVMSALAEAPEGSEVRERALDLLARVEEAVERRNAQLAARSSTPRRPRPGDGVEGAAEEGGEPASEAEDAAPRTDPAAEAPGDATLRVIFDTQVSEGVLTLYVGQDQALREPYRFTRKTSFFRSEGVPGKLERSIKLSPGEKMLRVYVAMDRTRVETIEGNFPAGSTRVLEIKVGKTGAVSLSLR